MLSKLPSFQEIIKGVKQTAARGASYFNPTSNQGQNFWSTPVAQRMANVQKTTQPYVQPLMQSIGQGLESTGRLYAHSNPLNRPERLQEMGIDKPTGEDYRKAGVGALQQLGIATAPARVAIGGAIGGAFQAGSNIIQRKPMGENVPEAVGEWAKFSATLEGIGPIANTVLRPLLNKISPTEIKNINTYLNLFKRADNPATRTAIKNLIVKRIFQNIGKEAVSGFASMGGYGATMPAEDAEERVKNIIEQGVMGVAFGVGIRAIQMGGQAVGGQIIKPAIEKYRQLTPRERQAGSIKLGEPQGVGGVGGIKGLKVPTTKTALESQVPPISIEQPMAKPIEISSPIAETPTLQKAGEILKQREGRLGETISVKPETKLPSQGADSSETIIGNFKTKVNRFYTDVLDRFHPLSQVAKKGGEEQAMRNALTGHYGAGSTANYHVDFELTPILKEQSLNDLRRLAVAQRDVELAGRGIQGSNTGLTVDVLKKEFGPEKFTSVQGTLNKLYQYQDKMVKEYLVKTGIISEKAYSAMRAKNQFYVPFKRVMDQVDDFLGFVPQTRGAGSVGSQNVIKGIKGSERQIIDPVESILESTYKMVGLGKRQEVAKTIVSLKNKLLEGMISEVKGKAGNYPTISLFENGKVKKYFVPPEVAEAAKGLKEETMNTLIKILSGPTKVFRATATGINPEFMAPNVARDVQSAFVNVGLNPLKWVKGLAHMMRKDQLYQDFLKSGGKTSRISIDRPILAKTVKEIEKRGLTITKPSDLLKILQTAGEYSEQPTRIAVFENGLNKWLKKGLNKNEAMIKAAYEAQEASVNFARRGAKTQSVNAIYAFLNARAQGVDRLVRTIKSDPVGASFRIGLITQLPAIGTYVWNRNFDSYFDDRVISPTDRRTNFIIMLSDEPIPQFGGAQFVKIPKGDIGRLANPTEEFLRYAENRGGDVKKAMFDVIRGFSPWDNIGDLIPTALRPPIEATVNKSFFTGYPIVPEYKTSLPSKYQDSSYTAPLYRLLGQRLGVSPAKLQSIVEGYGTGLAKIGEMATRGMIPEQYKTAKNEQGAVINRTPIVRRFLGGEKRTEEEQVQSNLSRIKALDFDINDIKSAIKRGDIPLEEGLSEIKKIQTEQTKTMGTGGGGIAVSDADKEMAKLRFKYSDEPFTKVGNEVLYKEKDGSVGTTSLDFSVSEPTLTSSEAMNKELISTYKSKISSKVNEVRKLYEIGYFTEEQAITEIEKLTAQYDKTKKAKKFSLTGLPKLTLPSIKAVKKIKLGAGIYKKAKLNQAKLTEIKVKPLTISSKK